MGGLLAGVLTWSSDGDVGDDENGDQNEYSGHESPTSASADAAAGVALKADAADEALPELGKRKHAILQRF